jgi:hypothetical protein
MRSPNTDVQTLIKEISIVEAEAVHTVLQAEAPEDVPTLPYTAEDLDRELLIGAPYADAYLFYCLYRNDLRENQIENANNALVQYKELLKKWKQYRFRTYRPKRGAKITMEGYNI